MNRKLTKNNLSTGTGIAALLLGFGSAFPSFAVAQDTGANTFTSTDAEEEGYWYSRYNLGNLSMRSGLGTVVKPDGKVIMHAMAAADADFDPAEFAKGNSNYGDGDHITPPKNVAPLSSVYKSGDPHYIAKFNAPDFGTQRWDPTKMDKTLTGLANGFTIMKETEWARQFHVDDHFGTPSSDFGAYWRFVGAIMTMNAKMQTKSFLENMSAYDLSGGGDAAMLMAVADVADLLSVDTLAHSEVPNRYGDAKTAEMFTAGADKLFEIVNVSAPATVKGASLAIQSLVWYGAKTDNTANKAAAMKKIVSLTRALEAMKPANASEQAYYLRGLVEAKRTLGLNNGSIRSVAADFLNDFNMETGGFNSQHLYTIDEFGAIVGALNALRIFETADVDADQVNEVFTAFWEQVMNKGGLQMSAPPLKAAKSPFEYEGEPQTFFRYGPSQPVPPMAGGKFGVAPVFATSIGYENGKWSVVDANFDAAGSMHASNEMIWLHYDEINGFPDVDLADVLQ